jgi:hypothetical protein
MSKTGLLDFLSKQVTTLPEEVVRVESWDREITLRGLSSRERDEFEADNLRRANRQAGNGASRRRGTVEADLSNFRARLVARHIVEGGMRVLANERGEELLGAQPASVIDPLFATAMRLSGLSEADVEELTKNSDPTEDDEQSSDSPVPSGALSENSKKGSANAS